MRRFAAILLATVVCVSLLAGCDSKAGQTQEALLPSVKGIAGVEISSLPGLYSGGCTGKDATALAERILAIPTKADYTEDPNVYTGMTWVLVFLYEDGRIVTVELFANMFIQADDGPWYRVPVQDAQALSDHLLSLI